MQDEGPGAWVDLDFQEDYVLTEIEIADRYFDDCLNGEITLDFNDGTTRTVSATYETKRSSQTARFFRC